jgi:hypothetical protein
MAALIRKFVSLCKRLYQSSGPYIPNWTKGRPSTDSPPIKNEGAHFSFLNGTTAKDHPDSSSVNSVDPHEKAAQDAKKFFSETRAALAADYNGEAYSQRYGIWSFQLSDASKARIRRTRRQQIEWDELTLEQVETTIKNHHIDELIKQRFAGATSKDKQFLRKHILKEMDAGEAYTDWNNCLENFLALGLDGIRKKRRWDKIKRWLKAALRLLWPVFRNLIALGLVLSIYNALPGQFETVVISILLLIYASVSLNLQGSAFLFSVSSRQGEAQYSDLRRSLGKPIGASEQETLDSNIQKTNKDVARVIIHSTTMGLIDLIALWNLAKALQWF